MEKNDCDVTPEKLIGKTVSDVAVTAHAVVIQFTDNTYVDIYLDSSAQTLKTSTNKLEG